MPKKNTKTITYNNFNIKGEKTSQSAFTAVSVDPDKYAQLLAQTVRVYLTNQRQGTGSTKTRGEVTGSTKKIYRQKGTGRARHGSIKAPLFVGGGIVFGPRPRDFTLQINKKMRQKAFLISIVDKLMHDKFIVIEDLINMPAKTKNFYALIKKIYSNNLMKEKLLLISNGNKNLLFACRNIKKVDPVLVSQVNTYDILSHSQIIVDKVVLDKLFARIDNLPEKAEKKQKTRLSKKVN